VIELTARDIAWAMRTARNACRRMGLSFTPEVEQEAHVAVWQASLAFDPDGPATFRTWAYQRVVYSMRQRSSSETWQLTVLDAPDSDGTSLAETLPHANGDPAKRVPAREIVALLRARSTHATRRVLDMLASGFNQTEIARRLGVSRQAVSQHIARLRDIATPLTRA